MYQISKGILFFSSELIPEMERSSKIKDIPENQKKVKVTIIFKKGRKGTTGCLVVTKEWSPIAEY